MSEQPQIMMPNMCPMHQWLLVDQAGYGPDDVWQALIIVSQIALFQAATTDPRIQRELEGDIEKLPALGCLACQKPDAFGTIVEAAKSHDLGDIKRIGERWVSEASKGEAT